MCGVLIVPIMRYVEGKRFEFMKKQYFFLFSLLTAVTLLFVGSANSPLFPYNVWDDANCFFTVGRSMFHGKVLYRDIFEQKGMYLYVIYGLGGLISKTTFFGPFLLEIFAITIFLYYAGKTMRYYVGSGSVMIALPLILTLLLTSACFEKGGSAEEFCLPFFMIWMCHAIEVFGNKGSGVRWYKFFIDGILFSIVFWIKFNVALIFVGGYLAYMIYFIVNKRGKMLLPCILLAVAGFVTGSLPCLIYFAVNGAVSDLWFGYFYSNLFLYQETFNWWDRVIYLLGWTARYIKENMLMSVLAFLGIFGFARRHRKTMGAGQLFLLLMMCFFWFACVVKPTVIGVYYTLPNILFAVFGVLELAEVLRGRGAIRIRSMGVIAVALVLCIGYVYYGSNPAFLLEIPKEELAPYEFAQIIKQEKNATVLNYGCLDTGIYTLSETEPPTKYFCRLNLQNFDQMDIETRRLIDEKKVDFIVILNGSREEDESLKGYHRIAFKEQYLTGATCYHLYKKNK